MTATCTNPAQRGFSLIEAMIGALLTGILLLGISYGLTRVLVSQRGMNTQSIAMLDVREQLATASSITSAANCALSDITFPNGDSLSVNCELVTLSTSVSIPSLSDINVIDIDVQSASVATGSSDLLGGAGMKFSY